ncbi:MAG: ankyrin repeat domain-containing protein [Flavobacteriales bacterium]|nr:ankyrin repeat domain-containing protein [Flavobacteriales bacterium]
MRVIALLLILLMFGTHASGQSGVCDSAFKLVERHDYVSCQQLLVNAKTTKPCVKSVTTSNNRSRPKKWFPGFMIVAILSALGPRTSTHQEYLYKKVLDDSVSVERDNLIRFMLTQPGQFDFGRSGSFMEAFLNNDQNLKDVKLLEQVYDKCTYAGRLTAFAFSMEHDLPSINRKFISGKEWRMDKRDIVKLTLENGRVDLLDSFFVHGLAPDIRFGVDSVTIPHLLTQGLMSKEKFETNLQFFEKHNLDLWAKDAFGRTVLHKAMIKGRGHLPGLLLERCPNINEVDKTGQTYFHYTVLDGNFGGSKLLKEHGIDIHIKDTSGHVAGDYVDEWNIGLLKICEITPSKEIENTVWLHHYFSNYYNKDPNKYSDENAMEIIRSKNYRSGLTRTKKTDYSIGNTVITGATGREKIEMVKELLNIYKEKGWKVPDQTLKMAESNHDIEMSLLFLEYGVSPWILCKNMAERKYWYTYRNYPDTMMQWLRVNYLTPIYNDETGKYHLEDYELHEKQMEYDSIIPFGTYRVTPVRLGNKWGLIDIAGTIAVKPKFDRIEIIGEEDRAYFVITHVEGKKEMFYLDHFIDYDLGTFGGTVDFEIKDIWKRKHRGSMRCILERDGKFGVGTISSRYIRKRVIPTYDEARRLGNGAVGLRNGADWSIYSFGKRKISKPKYSDVKFENGLVYGKLKRKWRIMKV